MLAAADKQLSERVDAADRACRRGWKSSRQTASAPTPKWAGLVQTYEAMKPREAAAIFDALDMQVLLQVLDRMQERRAAPVLAAMQPDRARLATQMLAEMRTAPSRPPACHAAPPDVRTGSKFLPKSAQLSQDDRSMAIDKT